jgi:transcriptional regulator with XRE-family HTH domain
MTAKQFRLALKDLGLSRSRGAAVFGLSRRTVIRYAQGARGVPTSLAILLNLLVLGVISLEQVDTVR